MPDTTATGSAHPIGFAAPNFDEKYRRVINRRGRLELLVEMRAPGIIVRNERRMLKAAEEDLFDGADIEEVSLRSGPAFSSTTSTTPLEPRSNLRPTATGNALRA